MKRIGVFGGTFNPIHNGHIVIAEEVLRVLNLNKIIFVPANIPPHKEQSRIAQARDRYKMVELALEYNNNFEASDIEINRDGPSYSIDTISELKSKYSNEEEFYFIIGADTTPELSQWREINKLLKIIKFVVINRPKYPLKDIPQGALRIQIKGINISSSKIRELLEKNESIHSLVPETVEKYISKKGLYKDGK